jgi:hypothetical protein
MSVQVSCIVLSRGIFVTERRSGTSFPGIGVLTPPLSDRILGHSLRSGTFLRRKISLVLRKLPMSLTFEQKSVIVS